jgi:hypothetical protein
VSKKDIGDRRMLLNILLKNAWADLSPKNAMTRMLINSSTTEAAIIET